jgi:hypothetical protein
VTDRDIVHNSPRVSGETSKRSGVDRRQGLGRRIVRERRRDAKDRRSGVQRRVLQDRRSGGYKREPVGPIF